MVYQSLMISSTGKYLNDSLNISVNAVLTKSLINGRTNGKPGCHMLLIRKSAVFSKKNIE